MRSSSSTSRPGWRYRAVAEGGERREFLVRILDRAGGAEGAHRAIVDRRMKTRARAQAKRAKQRKLDHSLYDGRVKDLFGGTPSEPKENLFLEGFAKQYPDVYRRIVATVHTKYDQLMSGLPPGAMTPYEMETRKNKSIEDYCRMCVLNFDKGKRDYYPPILVDDTSSDE